MQLVLQVCVQYYLLYTAGTGGENMSILSIAAHGAVGGLHRQRASLAAACENLVLSSKKSDGFTSVTFPSLSEFKLKTYQL